MYRQGHPLVHIQHALALSDRRASGEAVSQMAHASNLLLASFDLADEQVPVVRTRWQLRRVVLHVCRCWNDVTHGPQLVALLVVHAEHALDEIFHDL